MHTTNMTPNAVNRDPWVIHPYYTGRDKGALMHEGGIMAFFSQGHAWRHIFTVVQPNDVRACTNYRVIRLSEYSDV